MVIIQSFGEPQSMKYFLVFCMGAASLSCKSRSQSGLLAEPELRADAIKYSQQLIQEVYAKRKEIESKVDQLKPLMKTRRRRKITAMTYRAAC